MYLAPFAHVRGMALGAVALIATIILAVTLGTDRDRAGSVIRRHETSPLTPFADISSKRATSRLKYQTAFCRSVIGSSAFSPARQIYFTALPRLKFICSVTVMHSTPDGWAL